MSVTLSDKYYLKALEAYPFDLSEAMESLNYSLSYNSDNAGAHCLLGQLYMLQLRKYEMAKHHFEQALISDISYTVTYEHYCLLLIELGEMKRAQKLIDYAMELKGINVSTILHRKGYLYEKQHKLKDAKKNYKKAYQNSCDEEERMFLLGELERVKTKIKEEEK